MGEQSSNKLELVPINPNGQKQIMAVNSKHEISSATMLRGKVEDGAVDDEIIAQPRAQKYNRFLGQQIRIEINQHTVAQDELNTNHAETQNLLFYDFNSGARHFRFGTTNVRLATKGEFRRTGMEGAQFIDK